MAYTTLPQMAHLFIAGAFQPGVELTPTGSDLKRCSFSRTKESPSPVGVGSFFGPAPFDSVWDVTWPFCFTSGLGVLAASAFGYCGEGREGGRRGEGRGKGRQEEECLGQCVAIIHTFIHQSWSHSQRCFLHINMCSVCVRDHCWLYLLSISLHWGFSRPYLRFGRIHWGFSRPYLGFGRLY